MSVTMKEIDALRERVDSLRKVQRECHARNPGCGVDHATPIRLAEIAVEAALREWWAQGCREVGARGGGLFSSHFDAPPAAPDLYTCGLPDPMKIAKSLLDSMTGGALAVLISWAQDCRPSGPATGGIRAGSLAAALRALGEKID